MLEMLMYIFIDLLQGYNNNNKKSMLESSSRVQGEGGLCFWEFRVQG